MTEIEVLREDIANDLKYANELMGRISRLLTAGEYASASVWTDYLQGRIKSAERSQKRITKLEAKK